MKLLITAILFSTISIFGLASQAQMRQQSIEIDGQKMESSDAMDLLLNRGSHFVISDFKSVKINGSDIVPYVMRSGESIFVRTISSGGDTTSYQSKLQSPKKFAIACNRSVSGVPDGVEVKSAVLLHAGDAVFAWLLADDPDASHYVVNGQTKTLFLCNPTVTPSAVSVPTAQ